jgi:hypothetical protein
MGRFDSLETRMKKSSIGPLNPFYGKGPGKKALDLAAQKLGTVIYVYDAQTLQLVNGKPFRSIRATCKDMPISPNSLMIQLDTGKAFKGYLYYSKSSFSPL